MVRTAHPFSGLVVSLRIHQKSRAASWETPARFTSETCQIFARLCLVTAARAGHDVAACHQPRLTPPTRALSGPGFTTPALTFQTCEPNSQNVRGELNKTALPHAAGLPNLGDFFALLEIIKLLHQLNLARTPGLVEPRIERAVEAQDHEPAFAGNRLHPVAFFSCRSFRAKINIYRAIDVDLKILVLAAHAGELLVGLDHRAGLVVINNGRPEVLHRDMRWQMQLVVLSAFERITVRVLRTPGILRTFAHHLLRHGRGDTGGEIIEECSPIQIGHAGCALELVAAKERQTPRAAGIEEGILVTDAEGNRPGSHSADIRGILQNFLHAGIGIEGLALLNADCGKEAQRSRIGTFARFLLDDFIQETPERVITRRNKVRRNAGSIDELSLRGDWPHPKEDKSSDIF